MSANRRPSFPKLSNRKASYGGSNNGPPENASRRSSTGSTSRFDNMNHNKRPATPGLRGNSPPNPKRSRAQESNASSEKYVSSSSPTIGSNPPSRHNSISGSLDAPTGPGFKTRDGRRIDAYRPGPVRSQSDTAPPRKGSVDSRSPLDTMSPMSMHGELASASGRSSPVQVAPTAPSMAPISEEPPTASFYANSRILRQSQDANAMDLSSVAAMRTRKRRTLRLSNVNQDSTNSIAEVGAEKLAIDASAPEFSEGKGSIQQKLKEATFKALQVEVKRMSDQGKEIREQMKAMKVEQKASETDLKQVLREQIRDAVQVQTKEAMRKQVKSMLEKEIKKAQASTEARFQEQKKETSKQISEIGDLSKDPSLEQDVKTLLDFKGQIERFQSQSVQEVENLTAQVRQTENKIPDMTSIDDFLRDWQKEDVLERLVRLEQCMQRIESKLTSMENFRELADSKLTSMEDFRQKTESNLTFLDKIPIVQSENAIMENRVAKLEAKADKMPSDLSGNIRSLASALIQETDLKRSNEINSILNEFSQRLASKEKVETRGPADEIFQSEIKDQLAKITQRQDMIERSVDEKSQEAVETARQIANDTRKKTISKTVELLEFDQQTRNEKIETVQRGLAAIETRLSTARGYTDGTSADLSRSPVAVSMLPTKEEVSALKSDVLTLNGALGAVEEELHQNVIVTQALKTQTRDTVREFLNDQFNGFKNGTNQNIQSVKDKLAVHDKEILQLKQSGPTRSGSRINSPQPSLHALEQQVNLISTSVQAQNASLKTIDQALRDREQGEETLRRQIAIAQRAYQSLELRYENINTDHLSQQMVHTMQQMYPDAPGFLQKLGTIQNDIKLLREHEVLPWIQKIQSLQKFEHIWATIIETIARAERAENKVDDQITRVESLDNRVSSLSNTCNDLVTVGHGHGDFTELNDKVDMLQDEWNRKYTGLQSVQASLQGSLDMERKERIAGDENVRKTKSREREKLDKFEKQIGHVERQVESSNKKARSVAEAVRKVDELVELKPKVFEIVARVPFMMGALAKQNLALNQVNQNLPHPVQGLDLDPDNRDPAPSKATADDNRGSGMDISD